MQNNAPSNSDNYFMQKQIEIMIDINNKKITNELNNMKEILSKLSEEISDIKRNLNANRVIQRAEPVAIPDNNTNINQNNTRPNNGQPLRPRYGDYKPGDVSINKFFYFGNKKIK